MQPLLRRQKTKRTRALGKRKSRWGNTSQSEPAHQLGCAKQRGSASDAAVAIAAAKGGASGASNATDAANNGSGGMSSGSPRSVARVYVPILERPDVNWIGLLLKGSTPETMNSGPRLHLFEGAVVQRPADTDEDLHVLITGNETQVKSWPSLWRSSRSEHAASIKGKQPRTQSKKRDLPGRNAAVGAQR